MLRVAKERMNGESGFVWPGAIESKLPAVFDWPGDFTDRHLDAIDGDVVAAVPPDRLGLSLGIDRLFQPDPESFPIAAGGSGGRSLESTPRTLGDSNAGHDSSVSGSDRRQSGRGCRLAIGGIG